MEVCCLKMASRCRPARPVLVDVTRLPTIGSSHNCGSLSRVVMVRKTDQRMINHKKPEADPQCEIITFETIQTYRGHKPDRTVVIKESHDLPESEVQKSPSAQRFLKSNQQSTSQSLCVSSNDLNKSTTMSSSIMCSSIGSSNSVGSGGILRNGLTSSAVSTPSPHGSKPTTPTTNIKHKSPSPSPSYCGGPIRKLSAGYNEFEKSCLKAHNDFRIKHGVMPLKLNKKLCRFAEEWARVIAARGTPIHRNNSPYGENIFCSWNSNDANAIVKGWEPVEHWYSEGCSHTFGREPTTLKTGHFTQVIWKDSRELGVGQSRNRSGQIFIVANYDPPGNFIGSFTENVPPIGGFSSDSITAVDTPKIVIDCVPDNCLVASSFEDALNKEALELEKFAKAILKYHNEYRKRHLVPDLKLSKQLCVKSQEWAQTLAREDRFAHRPNTTYGENIYCLWSSDRNAKANPKDVCRSWYEEIKEYDFCNEPKGVFKAGHFTQLIWKTSQDLGVGVAKTKQGKVVVVCNYNPRGNIVGQFGVNVLRARF